MNLQPFSAFFTEGQATIYPQRIEPDFKLSASQDQLLDDYLEKRFQGDFRMAGIKFWSEMHQLPTELLEQIDRYNALVPVFTNVIFDTSQAHANTHFEHMFEWLDLVLETASRYPDTLFVIRAHPDEMRVGKASQESVMDWADKKKIESKENLLLIGPDRTLSSYELIQRSRFVMVYNSSIGLEASLMGRAVLCAGKARYTQYPTVIYPGSRQEYQAALNELLTADKVDIPVSYQENARRFLFYQLYRSSLPFGDFLTEHTTPGYVQLKRLSREDFSPGSSPVLDRIVAGILEGGDFVLETDR